ncbi:MAG TPA: GspE/PulE family protein [Candidatus Paceibacterota bacterium]|nr:GspE/PulE family protein [Candidatus Paceibacterota bacterium]
MLLAENMRARLGRRTEGPDNGESVSIIALVDDLVAHACEARASDIHIHPTSEGVRVRLRVDGVLRDQFLLPMDLHQETISRIKVLAGLRTDEHQAAQDGRVRHVLQSGEQVDIRVSVVPSYHGETVVLRLLSSRKAEDFTLESFGFSDADTEKILSAIRRQGGMVLSTGPTGSGKTTTLYTLLGMLNGPETSIITIEDPIEYAIRGVKQIQVNQKTGLTFATGLRSILRQDPNIIMVGEIRDPETAGIAVNTALTGHLLLSTLHTNDAATTLPRLLDMGIDSYLVASTISLAIGQRLVRRICKNCRQETKANGETLYKGKGCIACHGSGYAGRMCINEVLQADDDIRDAVVRRAPAKEINAIARKAGMTSMLEDGLMKARRGETTMEEVLRAVHA